MKVESIDSSVEDRILIGMITDPIVLVKLFPYWKEDRNDLSNKTGPLLSKWTNRIAKWCITHYKKHQSVPKAGIKNYFERWASKHSSNTDVRAVEDILIRLNNSFENGLEIDASQLLDEAIEHINYVRLRQLSDSLISDINARDTKKALDKIHSFVEVKSTEDEFLDFLSKDEEIESVFAESTANTLINFEDPLGGVVPGRQGLKDFFQHTLCRDGFIAIQGSDKSGKSYLLQELALQAVTERRRVAFFEVGDMSKAQIGLRILTRIAQHPIRSPDGGWPYNLSIPCELCVEKADAIDKRAKVKHKVKTFTGPLDVEIAKKARKIFLKRQVGTQEQSFFKLIIRPNMTVNVDDIQAQIRAWQINGWMPDVIVIDYCDILGEPSGKFDKQRDKINATWAQLRRLSEENHCLVLTATQANSDAYQSLTQSRKNFSEDKRKNSHVTGLLAINASPTEKQAGVMRLNWLFTRDLPFGERDFCYTATCLALANPFVQTKFPSIVRYKEDLD